MLSAWEVRLWHVLVSSRQAEDCADVSGLGEDARLLTEGEGAVDRMLAAQTVQGGDQFLAEDGGLE
jgi:hypothetical protein